MELAGQRDPAQGTQIPASQEGVTAKEAQPTGRELGTLRTSSPGGSISGDLEKTVLRRWGSRELEEFLREGQVVGTKDDR